MSGITPSNETDYEDLLALWSDLEAGLGVVLGNPQSVEEFEQRIWQYDSWMQGLLARDSDVGLYLLFQLAIHSSVGYSASHALICSVLCHLIAQQLEINQEERNSLAHAALTMNIGMTALQDQLALQAEKLSPEQTEAVRSHPLRGHAMLETMGVQDPLWQGIVIAHHDENTDAQSLFKLSPPQRLVRILRLVDRFAAMISPRKYREGRSVTESVRSLLNTGSITTDEVGQALVSAVGVCPPGTYVRLEDKTLAVVMRRSPQANLPHLAVVTDARGAPLAQPRLHRTVDGSPTITSALSSAQVRLQPNHHVILQLGAYAAQSQ
jgi:HD-GYP domain-containing protein (c-di-GMP phosphodiesterase class II)